MCLKVSMGLKVSTCPCPYVFESTILIILTIHDLRNLFVDDDTMEFGRIQEEHANSENNTVDSIDENVGSSGLSVSRSDETCTDVVVPSHASSDATNYAITPMHESAITDATFADEGIDMENGVEGMIQESVISDILDRVNDSLE